ncbi:GTPase, partial [Thermophilibacter provencensis]|uniref:GTPase n=1 Tax=Thermophilibacter provencensis TaxID=1852386 RepID=UPI003AA97DBC
MGLSETSSGERAHIAFFGVRNAGKSSVVNAVLGQELSVVSDVRGTTTDPVRKAMELLPLGPVVIVDTPGVDDGGALGAKRVDRSLRTLASCDAAVLVVDGERGLAPADRELVRRFGARGIPYAVAWNKCDLASARAGLRALGEKDPDLAERAVAVSALTGEGVDELKERLARLARPEGRGRRIVADLVRPGSVVVLVCPIDASAPKGRLILPQQMAIRDLLDAGCVPVVCRETELARSLAALVA